MPGQARGGGLPDCGPKFASKRAFALLGFWRRRHFWLHVRTSVSGQASSLIAFECAITGFGGEIGRTCVASIRRGRVAAGCVAYCAGQAIKQTGMPCHSVVRRG
eukprot:EG_transcript_37982